jgi:hypothetical protein
LEYGASRRFGFGDSVKSGRRDPLGIPIATLAKALNVSTDELLGFKQTKETLSPNLAPLWRRLKVIENFSEKEKKSVLQYLYIIAGEAQAETKSRFTIQP